MILIVAIKYDHKEEKNNHFYCKDSASLNLKFAVLDQNWEEINCLRHHNFVAPLDEIHGSKAVDYTLLGITEKIGETRIKRKVEFLYIYLFLI